MTFQGIMEAARPNSNIVITANFKAPVEFDIPMIQRREIKIIGHMMYVREDYEDAILFLAKGMVDVSKFISKRFTFDEYPEAFRYADQYPDDIMKLLVEL